MALKHKLVLYPELADGTLLLWENPTFAHKITLVFCRQCLTEVQTRSCDGSTKTRVKHLPPCVHLLQPLYVRCQDSFIGSLTLIRASTRGIDDVGHLRITGDLAIEIMRNEVRGIMGRSEYVSYEDDEELQELFVPELVYQHIDSCIHGSHPTVTIQGSKNIFESIYYKRCNEQFVNGLGQVLDNGAAGVGLTLEEIREIEIRDLEQLEKCGLTVTEEASRRQLARVSWARRGY